MLKFLMLLLAIRLTTSDKLDRIYLPPPGAKFSGGNPEDLEVPLEFPKESHQTTIESHTEPNFENVNDDTTSPIDFSIESGEYSFESFSNTLSNPNAFIEVTPKTYFSDDSYKTTLDSNQAFSQRFLNKPSESSITSTEEPEFQEITTITSNIQSTQSLPEFGLSDQQSGSIFRAPTRHGQLLGPNFYQSNSETDFYQNNHPYDLELNTQTGNQQNLPSNLLLKHQNTAYVQKDNISEKTEPKNNMMSDSEIDGSTKDNKDRHLLQTYPSENNLQEFGKFMYSNNENGLPLSGQNKNNEGYRTYYKYNDNKPESNTVTITPSYDILGEVSPAISFSMHEMGKKNIDTQNIITYRPERPQAAADRSSVILNYKNVITPERFAYSFDSSNGIHADESGTALNGVKAEGAYSYTGDDGKMYSVTYTADENGYQPRGDHLPTPPPMPKLIQRQIEEAARDKEAGKSDDGSYDEAKYGYKKYQGAMDYYSPEIQGISLEGIELFSTKRKMNSHRRPVAVAKNKPYKYEGYTENKYDSGNGETDSYNNQLSQRPINKLPESNKMFMKSDSNEQKSLMKDAIPVLKTYAKDKNQHKATFKVSGTDGVYDNETIQAEHTPTTYNQYYDRNEEIMKNILQDANKYSSSPINKLNDDEINLSLVNFNKTNGALNTNDPSIYKDFNSGYHYENPAIKFGYEFNKNPLNGDERNHFKQIIYPSKSISNEMQMSKFEQGNTSQEGNHKYFNEDQIPVSNIILKTGIGGRPHTTPSSYQQNTQQERDFKVNNAMLLEENTVNYNSENLKQSSGYFLASSTTPMSAQSATLYTETESTTMKVYPTTYKSSVIPRTDYYDDRKATEYPDETIKPSAIPPRSEIFNAFVSPNANVIVDGFGRPLTTEQPDREFTGYIYGPGFSTTNEMDGIYLNLPSTSIYKDETDDSEIYSFKDTDNSPYDAIKNFNNQEEGFKENQENLGGHPDLGGLTRVFDENHSTTERLIGEDFSGPKQPQSYDPETGYIYK